MEKFEFGEHEANGHTPHHILAKMSLDKKIRLMRIIERENIAEIPESTRINHNYISPREIPNNIGF